MRSFNVAGFLLAFIAAHALAKTPEGLWLARSPMLNDKVIGKVKISIIQGKLQGELIEIIPLNKDIERFCWREKIKPTGPVMMCGYHEENGKWVGGRIYESSTGKAFLSEVRLSPEGNHLLVKGMVGVFSDTAVWDRLSY